MNIPFESPILNSEDLSDKFFIRGPSREHLTVELMNLPYPAPAFHILEDTNKRSGVFGLIAIRPDENWKPENSFHQMENPSYTTTPVSDTLSDPSSANGLFAQCSYESQLSVSSPPSGNSLSKKRTLTHSEDSKYLRERCVRQKIVKPLVATVYWQEEKTTCYQVKANNVVVSRRESDNYVNGTKLLNATGMSRGRRDGILKSERGRSVIRNGSMNLKGVWIPFHRAFEIARNEGLKDLLFPLFVEDILRFYDLQESDITVWDN